VCVLAANAWCAQVLGGANGSVVAEYVLTFENGVGFEHNITAFPFQSCTQNWGVWSGTYAQPDAGTVVFSYVRCTPGGAGCLACGATRIEATELRYAVDCTSLTLSSEESGECVTFCAVKGRGFVG
jgi:hypothetical protein